MDLEPFNKVDTLTALMMELCAARLDAQVTAEQFSSKLTMIVQEARSQGYQVGRIDGEEQISAKAANSANVTPPPKAPAAAPIPEALRNIAPSKRHGKLSDDDKARIYLDYLEVTKGRERAPWGWAAGKARYYKVSDATIYNTVREFAYAVHNANQKQ